MRFCLAAALLAAAPAWAAAQQHAHDADPPGVGATMSGPLAVSPHLALTAARPASRADSARAAAIADTLRRAIGRYSDVRAAERAGYRIFAPEVKQPVYHFTHYGKAFREHFRFDPADPSSLLYRNTAAGGFVLVGAMYTAPKAATPDELNARVPLSVARWHAHTNVCVPRQMLSRERWAETRGGKPVFGADGAVTTRAECERVGGRFHPQLFGWMVHANVFAGDSVPAWGEEHRHGERAGGH